MISVSELRIGNYVKTHNSLCWVTTIFEQVPDSWDKIFQNNPPTKEDIQKFHKWRGGCILVESSDDIITPDLYCNDESTKPIPITEEWLLKFGFEKTPEVKDPYESEKWNLDKVEIIKYIYAATGEYYEMYMFGWGKKYFVTTGENVIIKYIHQLQNLYFALIGEELKIK